MRISDFSSAVCSSDLLRHPVFLVAAALGLDLLLQTIALDAVLPQHGDGRGDVADLVATVLSLHLGRPVALRKAAECTGQVEQRSADAADHHPAEHADQQHAAAAYAALHQRPTLATAQIGSASRRERVGQSAYISGVAVPLKKQHT